MNLVIEIPRIPLSQSHREKVDRLTCDVTSHRGTGENSYLVAPNCSFSFFRFIVSLSNTRTRLLLTVVSVVRLFIACPHIFRSRKPSSSEAEEKRAVEKEKNEIFAKRRGGDQRGRRRPTLRQPQTNQSHGQQMRTETLPAGTENGVALWHTAAMHSQHACTARVLHSFSRSLSFVRLLAHWLPHYIAGEIAASFCRTPLNGAPNTNH